LIDTQLRLLSISVLPLRIRDFSPINLGKFVRERKRANTRIHPKGFEYREPVLLLPAQRKAHKQHPVPWSIV
ncbi:hypothetical protein KCU85_g264, partial [Aureobasidium melanogenum]